MCNSDTHNFEYAVWVVCPVRTGIYQFMDQGSRQQSASFNIWVYTHVVNETFACKGQLLTNSQFTRGYESISKSAACSSNNAKDAENV